MGQMDNFVCQVDLRKKFCIIVDIYGLLFMLTKFFCVHMIDNDEVKLRNKSFFLKTKKGLSVWILKNDDHQMSVIKEINPALL